MVMFTCERIGNVSSWRIGEDVLRSSGGKEGYRVAAHWNAARIVREEEAREERLSVRKAA
jgi:hypothetical protein